MCERCSEAREALSMMVPAMRAHEGKLPEVGAGPEAIMVNASTGLATWVVADNANEVAHVFEYPMDMTPTQCMCLSVQRIHAPFN